MIVFGNFLFGKVISYVIGGVVYFVLSLMGIGMDGFYWCLVFRRVVFVIVGILDWVLFF